MNILVYEDEIELKNLFEHIDSHISMKVDFCESYESGKFFYDNNKYDIVIINFSLDYGQNLLDYILDKNDKQRIMTISEKLCFSEKNGCNYCIENYNKIRLLKPIDVSELIKSIKQFDTLECSCANKFYNKDGLLEVMSDIARRFNGANYDSTKKSFSIKDSNSLLNLHVEDKKVLEIDSKKVYIEAVNKRAHSNSDIYIHIPEYKTVFAGDLVFSERIPVIRDGNLNNWVEALEKIKTFKVEHIIGGHGKIVDENSVDSTYKYIKVLRDKVALALEDGIELDDAAKNAPNGPLIAFLSGQPCRLTSGQ